MIKDPTNLVYVADEWSENTVVNGGKPREAALPTSSGPASASTVMQSTSIDSTTHGEMLVVGSPQVQPSWPNSK